MAADFALDEQGNVKKPKRQNEPEPEKDTGKSSRKEGGEGSDLQHLQRTAGNAAVQRLLAQRAAKAGEGGEVDEETAAAIRNEQGQGTQVDRKVAGETSAVTGDEYDDVKIHTDAKADQISRKLGAEAFTVGNDIFFKEGKYAPQSDDGKQLLSHELTHVSQQAEGKPQQTVAQRKMGVTPADDKFETEADQVAKAVSSGGEAVQRAEAEPEEEEVSMKRDDVAQREPEPEEEEVSMKRDDVAQREPEPEEEEVSMKRSEAIQRAEAEPEEEEVSMKRDDVAQREPEPEEEEVSMKRSDTVQRTDAELEE